MKKLISLCLCLSMLISSAVQLNSYAVSDNSVTAVEQTVKIQTLTIPKAQKPQTILVQAILLHSGIPANLLKRLYTAVQEGLF